MKNFALGIFAATLMAGHALPAAAAEPNVNPGMWEWRSKMEMPGMPYAMPEQVHRDCITKEDLVPPTQDPQQECQVDDLDIGSDKVTWVMECDTGEGVMRANGEIRYQGDHAEGEFTATVQGMQMITRLSGKRIGRCG
jgi:hypothetical protein